MPTYEYLCQTCSHRFETWQKMTDDPLKTCPECESPIRRVVYPASVVFKGSGFYKTDHGSSSAVANETSSDGKKAESTDGNAKSSQGESKTASETTTASTASSSNSSNNTSSSASKSTAPAGTK
jgi:putative FmdB family regulatory protein